MHIVHLAVFSTFSRRAKLETRTEEKMTFEDVPFGCGKSWQAASINNVLAVGVSVWACQCGRDFWKNSGRPRRGLPHSRVLRAQKTRLQQEALQAHGDAIVAARV